MDFKFVMGWEIAWEIAHRKFYGPGLKVVSVNSSHIILVKSNHMDIPKLKRGKGMLSSRCPGERRSD